jgi:ABC-type transport system involved in multi-copper enzyme maturation permease subunit
MNWLIWREYRLNRLILAAGAFLLLLPYVGAFIFLLQQYLKARSGPPIAEIFAVMAFYSLGLSQLTVALLGGNAIAGERADRSAEFIAYLPLPRTRLIGSKLTLAISAVAIVWGTNLLVLWILAYTNPESLPSIFRSNFDVLNILYNIAITGLVFYGVSWLISSLQSSPTFAIVGGLITPFLIIIGLHATAWSMSIKGVQLNRFIANGYTTICLILAILGFALGTLYYLRRVEP